MKIVTNTTAVISSHGFFKIVKKCLDEVTGKRLVHILVNDDDHTVHLSFEETMNVDLSKTNVRSSK